MKSAYRILPAADLDVDDQAAHLAREAGLPMALKFQQATRRTIEQIARMPGLGERRKSARPRLSGLRVWRVEGSENYLIFNRQVKGSVDIVRVLHGARDLDRILEADPSE